MSANSPISNFGSTSSATLKARSPRASSAASISSLSVGQLDLGLAGEAQPVLVDDLLVGLVDRLLNDIGHHRLP